MDDRVRGPAPVCSFCMRRSSEVRTLVAGPGAFICDDCVAASAAVVARGTSKTAVAPFEWSDLATEDLLATLPQVATVAVQAGEVLDTWVARARSRECSWTQIGAALGITKQSAWERFAAARAATGEATGDDRPAVI